MRWRRRDLWKAGIIVAGVMLLLVLMIWVPVSAAVAHERTSGPATPGTVTVQATPTEDATVTALNKEKLAQEVNQLKNQNEPDLLGWLRMNAAILLSTLVVVIGGLIGLFRWFGDRKSEREKRAEERFQAAVVGLGDDKEGVKIGAAILLRTFLRPGYEQFYTQTFDLAVANLRLPRTPHTPENTDGSTRLPKDFDTALPPTTLSQALIVVFKEAFPLARKQHRIFQMSDPDVPLPLTTRLKEVVIGSFVKAFPFARKRLERHHRQTLVLSQALDASGIVLDSAYLEWADLHDVWMPQASLRKAKLAMANLYNADLHGADLSGAELTLADLRYAGLDEANLSGAKLGGAKLYFAGLSEANLHGTNLSDADLTDADLYKADLSGADLTRTKLEVGSMNGTILHGVKGLSKEQLEACKAAGAIVDEDPTTSPSQSTSSLPQPSQNSKVQASSAPLAQGSLLPPDTGVSNAVPPQQDSES